MFGRKSALAASQIVAWFAVWGFWVVVNRSHHPTLAIDVVATGLLVAGCALAVYVHEFVIRPRYRNYLFAYTVWLIAVMAVSTVFAVYAIQFAYDLMWGPDPARFGWMFNFATDFVGIAVHVGVAAALRCLGKRYVFGCGRDDIAGRDG